MSKIDYSNFQLVTGKKRFKINNSKRIFGRPSRDIESIDQATLERKLLKVYDNWEFQEFVKDNLRILEDVQIEQKIQVQTLICFGIGSFASSSASLHQLAFSLRIQEHFNVTKVEFYDPILNNSEKRLLEQYNWHSMTDNCEGKYQLEEPALIFLPHCPKQLTNNFLWENWQTTKLSQAILICNSFSALISNTPTRFLMTEAEYILKIFDYVKEIPLDGKYFLDDVFNDTSIHILQKEKCLQIEEEFWERGDAPQYINSELITRDLDPTLKKRTEGHS